jgi:quinol monooxygenase YgiN
MIDADSELEIDSRLDSVAPRDATARAARDARDGLHRHARRGPSRPNRTSEDTRRAHERASRSRCEQAVLGQRELYVYWKTHDLTAALATASRMQAVLCSRIEGLQADLLQRDGSADGRFTVMEIYRHPQGIDGPLQSLIGNAASPALATLMASPRVVEAFRRVES